MTTTMVHHDPVPVPEVRVAASAAVQTTTKKIVQVAVVCVLFLSPLTTNTEALTTTTMAFTHCQKTKTSNLKTKIEIPKSRFSDATSSSDSDTSTSSPIHPPSSSSSSSSAAAEAEADARPTTVTTADTSSSSSCSYFQPSREFQTKRLQTSFRTIDWCPVSSMLPLQHYHAKKKSSEKSRRTCDRDIHEHQQKQKIKSTIAPDLETVLRDPSSYNLSKTSQLAVEDFLTKYGRRDDNRNDNNYELERISIQQTQQQQRDGDSQRLWNKLNAEYRASRPVTTDSLEILYQDEHMIVVNKPSGVLSVPGPRRNPSLLQVVWDVIRPPNVMMDQMVVHRLDMATSGILIYALSLEALTALHDAFKNRDVTKTYQALVDGHTTIEMMNGGGEGEEGEIDVLLERDPNSPPFMRVAHPRSTSRIPNQNDNDCHSGTSDDDENNGKGEKKTKTTHKFWREVPKPSLTTWKVISREWLLDDDGDDTCRRRPVTRLELRPSTGRTHQLRVHTSEVLGMPIVGDDIYHTASSSDYVKGKEQYDGDDEGGQRERPLCLHAQKICIRHPISGASMIFEADPPF